MTLRHIVIGRLSQLTRLTNTRQGNPMWDLKINGAWSYRTKPDTQATHNILTEHEDRRVYLITEGDETGEYVVGFELLGARNA